MSKLQKAVKSGDVNAVRALLAAGEDVNAREHVTHLTPLHRAAALGHADIVRALIQGGADVSADGGRLGTPLHGVADVECARLLIEAGAEVDARTKAGRTPLHEAAFAGRADIVSLLVDAGADVNALNDKNQTPLDMTRIAVFADKAHAEKYEPATKVLEAAGGELRSGDVLKVTATGSVRKLPKLVQRGEADEAERLLADDGVRTRLAGDPQFGLDWLLVLALAGDTRQTDALQVEPVKWAIGGHRMTPGHSEIAHMLIERGAHVDFRLHFELNDRGRRLLWEGFPPCFGYGPSYISWVGMLADPGDPFSEGHEGPTPLFLAVMNDDAGLVDALIGAGADPNARTTDDHTALHWAVLFGATSAAEHLLEGGADVNARTAKDKETPLAWALRRAAQEHLPPAAHDAAATIAGLLRSNGGVA